MIIIIIINININNRHFPNCWNFFFFFHGTDPIVDILEFSAFRIAKLQEIVWGPISLTAF